VLITRDLNGGQGHGEQLAVGGHWYIYMILEALYGVRAGRPESICTNPYDTSCGGTGIMKFGGLQKKQQT
jgi:hypothetical protein